MTDVESRQDIERVVIDFYEQVKADPVIGHVFTSTFRTDWKKHIPLMVDFWESAVFVIPPGASLKEAGPGYKGDLLDSHRHIHRASPLSEASFERWVSLFCASVDRHFQGPRAETMKQTAHSMASIMMTKLLSSS